MVLWLRKFDITEPKRFPFEVYLATACAGFAVPVTIRDSALPWSAQQAAARLSLRFPLEMVKFVAILMLVMIPFGLVLSSFPSTDRYFAFLSVPPAVFVLVIFVRHMRRQRKARGVFPLDKCDSVDALREFLHSIQSGRSPTAGGVAVFRIASEQWRDVVTTAIRHVDVVVVDVSTLSEHLLWEIEQAKACLRGRQLILVYGVDDDSTAELPRDVRARLTAILGETMLVETGRAYYPRRKLRWNILHFRANRAHVINLQNSIALGLLAAGQSVSA